MPARLLPPAAAGVAALAQPERKALSPGGLVWRRLRRSRAAALAGLVLAGLALAALGAEWVAPYDPDAIDFHAVLLPPGAPGHLLGTDDQGRDTLSRLIYGGRVSLRVGLIVVGIAGSLGVSLGAVSGYYGGLADAVIMRLADVLQAFPFLVLAIAVVAIVGPGLTNMMIVLGCVGWVEYARLVRSLVLSESRKDYVEASRALGASDTRLLWRHILPNVLGVIIVQATFGVAVAILAASALSYLGLGAQPPTAEWGAMLTAAKPYLRTNPALSLAPGLVMMITALSINVLGDALRDALDPKLQG